MIRPALPRRDSGRRPSTRLRLARGRGPLRVLIGSGPTREPLDPVRFLSNYSTGYMGACLARAALSRKHRITFVSGPSEFIPPPGARVIRVEQASQMQEALRTHAPRADVIIMAAAVCDFQPSSPAPEKLPRRRTLTLRLRATPDIIAGLPRRPGQLVVGFALETHRALERASAKLTAKRLDLIVAQEANAHSPFGKRAVQAFLIRAPGQVKRLGSLSKPKLAGAILDEIERLWYGERGTCTSTGRTRQRARGEDVKKVLHAH